MSIAVENITTVETLLFPSEKTKETETADALKCRLRAARIAAEIVLPTVGVDDALIDGMVAHGIAGLLDVPIIDVLLEALNGVGELEAAARSTKEERGRTDHVPLERVDITWTWKPSLDLIVNEKLRITIELEVQLALDIAVLQAEVRDGRLVDLGVGACDVTASLSAQGCELAKRPVFRVDPPMTIQCGAGIPLARRRDEAGRSAAPASGPTWVVVGGRPTVVAPTSA